MPEKIEIFKNYKCGHWRGIAWARLRSLNSTSLIGIVDVRSRARLHWHATGVGALGA